ncbi:MAG TPA: NUDIX hydrolase, partial [Marmoricola sp.]|nr:NUDIX hydrolase [Marmoricola sp.]
EFTIAQLRRIVSAALGYDVDATNLHRVLTRRSIIEPTGRRSTPGHAGGRPAALYRFRDRDLQVTDPFAVLRPPRTAARG